MLLIIRELLRSVLLVVLVETESFELILFNEVALVTLRLVLLVKAESFELVVFVNTFELVLFVNEVTLVSLRLVLLVKEESFELVVFVVAVELVTLRLALSAELFVTTFCDPPHV